MKITIAIDSFKGCMTSADACEYAARGFRQFLPDAQIMQVPVSDGGEGMLETIAPVLEKSGFVRHEARVCGPYGQEVSCAFLAGGGKCVLEMAQSCGLGLQDESSLDAKRATTYGLGQAVLRALDLGCRSVTIGLGGSATNDGGAGFAQALGARFYKKGGEIITGPVCGADLAQIERIDLSALDERIKDTKFTGTCDVANPLLGAMGATMVFGRQKGASAEDLEMLERGMSGYAGTLRDLYSRDLCAVPGAGAAGGMGAALMYYCGAELRPGIEAVMDVLDFDSILAGSALAVTGEGRIDAQSAMGKVPSGVAARAGRMGIPVVALCGMADEGAEQLYGKGVDAIFALCDGPMSIDESMANARVLMQRAAHNVARLFCAGKK